MIYIDIDGVLADSDGYLKSLNAKALDDTHLLFKTIYKNYNNVFRYSKPLIDLNELKELEQFTLLSALPNKSNIDSFTEDGENVDAIMTTLEENKKFWIAENIGECNYKIVNGGAEKSKFCQSPDDILIDDSSSNGKKWQAKGGKWYPSFEAFKKASIKVKNTKTLEKAELW